MFISKMVKLTLVAYNTSCIICKFVLNIVSTVGRHLFTTKGEAPAIHLGAEDDLD